MLLPQSVSKMHPARKLLLEVAMVLSMILMSKADELEGDDSQGGRDKRVLSVFTVVKVNFPTICRALYIQILIQMKK